MKKTLIELFYRKVLTDIRKIVQLRSFFSSYLLKITHRTKVVKKMPTYEDSSNKT